MTKMFTCAAAAVALLTLPVATASAQTAAQLNRLNAAMQMCNSPMASAVPECAQLRGQLNQGGYGAVAGAAVPGLGGNAGMAAGLLGAALGAAGKGGGLAGMLGGARGAAPVAPMAATGNGAALQAAMAACVQNAAGNVTVIQACASLANPASVGMAAPPAPVMGGMTPGGVPGQDPAMATYQAGLSYQACVAANPSGWQSCLQQMNANTNAGLLSAGVSPAQIQAAGGGNAAAAAVAPAAAKALMGLFGR